METITQELLENSLGDFAYNNKILVYQADPALAELLDINCDGIFLEPLLFGYFNNPDLKPPISLTQVLYGYIEPEKRPASVGLIFTNNAAYLPQLGTFHLLVDEPVVEAFLRYTDGELSFADAGGVALPFRLEPIRSLGDFELVTTNHPFFHRFLHQANPAVPYSVVRTIEMKEIALALCGNVEKALGIVKECCPAFYEMALLANSKLIFFDYPLINSFATRNLLGAVFFSSSLDYSGVAFYIDDLIHQMAHNILNALIFDKMQYFTSDIELLPFAPYSSDPNESRDIFNTFHGMLTCSFRVSCFREILQKDRLMTPEERNEVIARYIDQDRRFMNGPLKLPMDELFTEDGIELYEEIKQVAIDCLDDIRPLISKADFSNQVSRFSYAKYLEKNAQLKV